MEYLNILFLNSISSLIVILNGISFKKLINFKDINKNHYESGLYGLIVISIITFITNFFFKISSFVSILILITPVLFIIKDILPQRKKIILNSIILGLISSLIMYYDNTNRPDAGLYHLPFINIINESKIIFGLANLEFRFGHTSILQYLSAAFNNIIFTENGILLPQANIFAISVLYFINLIKSNSNTILKLIFFLFLFNILYSMNRYSGSGNDDPGHIFYYLAICNFFYVYFNKQENDLKKNVIFFSVFAFLIKPFLIFVFILPLILLLEKKINIFSKINIMCFFIIFFWLFKNVIISSCALYPISFTCFKSVEWTTLNSKVSNPERVSRTSEAWSKDWPNKKVEINQKDYIKKFNWLPTWMNNHYYIFLKEITPQLLLLLLLLLFSGRTFKDKNINKLNKKLLIITLLSSFLWFLKFPIYRYGQAYIISFFNLLFIFVTNYNFDFFKIKKNYINKFINIILIIAFVGILYKNFVRVYKNYENNYLNSPWPKMYSYTAKNEKNKNLAIYSKEGKFLYFKPFPYTLCMFSNSPCTSNVDVGEIKKRNKFGYKIYFY